MAEFAHEILLIELPFGVGMIVFALFVLLVIRWLQKRQKSDNRFVLCYSLLCLCS